MPQPSHSVAASAPPSGSFRFSLQGLLVTITLIAVALAVTSWLIWDQDEVWILRSWTCGALALGVLDRTRGKLGIIAAAVGGGLAPAAIVLHMWQSPGRYPLAHALWLSELGHNSVLLALAVGAMAAALVAALCCLASWRPWWLVAIALLVAIGLFAVRPSVWNERAVFELTTAEIQRPSVATTRVLALSSDGTRLAVERRSSTDPGRLEIWSIGNGHFREGATDVSGAIQLMEFSPDDSQLVIGSQVTQIVNLDPRTTVSRSVLQLAIHDPRTAARKSTLQAPANVQSLSRFRFTDDGSALVALGSLPYHQAVLAWDARTHELLCLVAIPRPIPGELLQALERARDQSLAADRALEPHTDSDRRWLALAREVLDLDGATPPPLPLPFPDRVVARSDKWAVTVHRQPNPPSLYSRLPFVRRLNLHDDLNQLQLVDPASGNVVRASRWIPDFRAAVISRDDGTIAAVTNDGKVRIWDVPD
jgi:WD40 repeat protein